jgi:hypothetical protein
MKELYFEAEMEVVAFPTTDVIVTSTGYKPYNPTGPADGFTLPGRDGELGDEWL